LLLFASLLKSNTEGGVLVFDGGGGNLGLLPTGDAAEEEAAAFAPEAKERTADLVTVNEATRLTTEEAKQDISLFYYYRKVAALVVGCCLCCCCSPDVIDPFLLLPYVSLFLEQPRHNRQLSL